ncbi:sporulation protein YunB [Fonticella tunisiensis]|uniref:Sporulation protein YunB n=1 Tax=Fonticella tunisiensis TaxID=1096341 RepID=A0A4R7KC71_9CLOT|nr:sporulation protein YunB [Fonticella tunisiensis]TDT50792.1 sporulation protein YunB [Fonticella tunisiensis]
MTGALKKSKYKKWVFLIVFFTFFIYFLYKLDHDLRPILMAYCDAEARITATQTINETVSREFGNKISYDDIMNVKTDKDGNVVMIQANTVELNRIGSEVAISVQKRIQNIEPRSVKIPLGVLLKNDLFAQYGPKITFKMQPVGSVNTTYRSEFEAAGINQTRHIVYLDVTTNILVIIPLAKNSVSLTSSIPIAESIIVGKVPEFYGNFQNTPGNSGSNNYGTFNR